MVIIAKNKDLTQVSRDYTINLHKLCHGIQFKKKAPKAVKVIRDFAKQNMLTEDTRIDSKLNGFLWNNGIRNIPKRVRVRLTRKLATEEDAKHKFYTLAELINVDDFKGLQTEKSK